MAFKVAKPRKTVFDNYILDVNNLNINKKKVLHEYGTINIKMGGVESNSYCLIFLYGLY